MSDKPKDQVTTDERAAIKDEILDEVTSELQQTPAPAGAAQSSEQIRRLARSEARPLIRTAVADHAEHCEHEGPLCSVAEKVDSLATKVGDLITEMAKGRERERIYAWGARILIAAGITVAGWFVNDKLATIRAQLQARQIATPHAQIEPAQPKGQLAQVIP
jgi:hypothetical protein